MVVKREDIRPGTPLEGYETQESSTDVPAHHEHPINVQS